ncbi:F0F1 ATP synthase subunit alpha [Candidatus Saganbacteria bacterium CG08_land_8_20_14_0_20_45_16]|uniref:ATP synthase subunit alpha n=1 Tax=Candidatus Saganbacteria bacterium CG08_land_8_20_14_0_20_45_16 TaxID=2014293 RepID=A0A2H0Y0R7_UNCSA|nr:MAG: F0F1 ATP synthase subunit alpha [Candidatus Saganbacteria bacterium CG08_land_8_20_14_0_20_45_16]
MVDFPNFKAVLEEIREDARSFRSQVQPEEVGVVTESGDGIAHVTGLPHAMMGETLHFSSGISGLVLNLEVEEVICILLGPHTAVREGDTARCTGRIMSVPVGPKLLGRVVNALGQAIDGKEKIKANQYRPLEYPAPAVIDRLPVDRPLQTGYKLIDALTPIGRGQRELIIGDRSSGKSSLAIDTIINQKGNGVICVYVGVGQKASNAVALVQKLEEHNAMDYTIIVEAPASDPAALQYLAPFAGCAMAEEFMCAGKDVLIIYDDLSKHAASYRMLSLLLRRSPGREAYPGDIFYLHSRLLERAANLSKERGGGSLTALPIVETQMGDISAYIPTNIISITDGQIFLDTNLFNAGIRPAVNIGMSVSRVGGKAQQRAMRRVCSHLRIDLAQFRERESFALFSSELDKETKIQLTRGQILTEILKQKNYQPLPLAEQVVMIYLGVKGFLDSVPSAKVTLFEAKFVEFLKLTQREILVELEEKGDFTPEWEARLGKLALNFKEKF